MPLRAEEADVRVVAHEPRHRLAEHGEVHAGRVHVIAEPHRLRRLDERAFAVEIPPLERIPAVKRLRLAVAEPPRGVVTRLGGEKLHEGVVLETRLEVIAARGERRVAAERFAMRRGEFAKPGLHERAAALVQVHEGVHERAVILVDALARAESRDRRVRRVGRRGGGGRRRAGCLRRLLRHRRAGRRRFFRRFSRPP